MKRETLKAVTYWTTTILGPASFIIGGILSFRHDPQMTAGLQHLGYPYYFPMILGTWKILGALATVVPGFARLKEWAYAGFVFELTGAAVSHAFSGDGAMDISAPLVFLALVVASWALRPASRRLMAEPNETMVSHLPLSTAPALAVR